VVTPDPLELWEVPDRQVQLERQDLKGQRVQLDRAVRQVSRALQDRSAYKDRSDSLDCQALQGHWDRQDHLVLRVQSVLRAHKDVLGRQEQRADPVMPEHQVLLDWLEPLGPRDRRVLRDHRVPSVSRDKTDSRDRAGLPDLRAGLERPGHRDPEECRDSPGVLERRDLREITERLEDLERQDSLAMPELAE